MPIPDRIQRTIEIARPVDAVWSAFANTDGLASWFGQRATGEASPGQIVRMEWDVHGDVVTGELLVQVSEPPRRFAFTWGINGLPDTDPRRTYVEFVIEPNGDGSTVTVTESGFAQLPDELLAKAYEDNIGGWEAEMKDLATYLEAAVDAGV